MSDFEELLPRYRGTVVELVLQAALRWPSRAALICGEAAISYADYGHAVIALAARIREIGKPKRVAVVMPNGPGACVAHFGVLAAGAQLLPMNPAYTPKELAFQLRDAQCGAIVADAVLHALVEPLAEELGLQILWLNAAEKGRADARADGQRLPARVDPDALGILQYTGGTSGRPKGVNLSHAALRTNVAQREALLPTREAAETILCAMPLFHSYGMAMGLYLAARCAGTLVVLPAFRRDDVFDAIERHRITILPGSPSIYVSLMAHPRFASTDWSSLCVCYSGASALPVPVLAQWEQTVRVQIFEGYGMTEAGPVLSFNGPLQPPKAGSVGLPLPGTEIQVVDAETGMQRLGAGQCGEIRARGPQIMQGYRNLPAESAQALRDGWLHTGDLGEFDTDGYLFIRGRKKDLIIVGGYNVYPREVEEVLLEHPSVLEAAVVGAPDSYLGEVLHAYVVPRPGAGHDGEALMRHCAQRIVRYKQPAHYHWLDELPKTGINKIDKKALGILAGSAAQKGPSPC